MTYAKFAFCVKYKGKFYHAGKKIPVLHSEIETLTDRYGRMVSYEEDDRPEDFTSYTVAGMEGSLFQETNGSLEENAGSSSQSVRRRGRPPKNSVNR